MIEIIHNTTNNNLDIDRLYDLLIDIVLEAEESSIDKEKSA